MDDRFISRARTGVIAALELTVTLGTPLGCIGYGIVAQAATDTEKSDTRNQLVQELGSDHQNDVDLASGNLTLRNRDVVLPGNGGMDIEVWRSYDLAAVSAGLSSSHNQSFKWAALGPGWRISAAPRIEIDDNFRLYDLSRRMYYADDGIDKLCKGQNPSTSDSSSVKAYLRLPTGHDERLYFAPTHALTKSGWKITCGSGQLRAYSRNGVTYDFGSYAQRKVGLHAISRGDQEPPGNYDMPLPSRSTTFYLATTARDVYGNTLSFTYRNPANHIPPRNVPGVNNGAGFTEVINFKEIEASDFPLTRISAGDGRFIDFTYSAANGRLSTMTDHTGRKWSYQYAALGTEGQQVLSKVTPPAGGSWSYAYGPGEFASTVPPQTIPLTAVSIAARKLQKVTNPWGGSVSYTYGFYKNAVEYRDYGAHPFKKYAVYERVASKTLSNGGTWNYSYTRGSAGVPDTTKVTSPIGVETYTFIGPAYNIATTLSASFHNTAWRIGTPVSKVGAGGETETYTWQNRLLTTAPTVVHELGTVRDQQSWVADLQKHTITRNGATYTTEYAGYDAYGNPGSRTETGPNGGSRVTKLTYFNDPTKWIIGRLKDELFPGSSVTRTFDTNGNVLAINRNGVVTGHTYDAQGNLASQTRPGNRVYTYGNYRHGAWQTQAQPEGISLTRVVDNTGNITSETNGEGKTTRYTFDGLNRVTSITPPSGTATTIAYTPTQKTSTRGAQIETTRYDPFGQVASMTLGAITTRHEYDALGRQTFVSHPGAATGTRYQYDAMNRVIRTTHADGTFQSTAYGPGTQTVTDERGKVSTSTYRYYGDPSQGQLMAIVAAEPSANVTLSRDTRDQITAVTQGGLKRSYSYNVNGYLVSVTNPETGVTTYGRDIAGNMTTRAVGASGVTRYAYDGQNRLTSVTYPGTPPAVTKTYNKNGKLLTSNATGGNRSFAYDAAGNLIQETLALDGKSFTAKYAYNGLDQLSSVTYPQSGRVVTYAPDALGRPTTVSGYVNNVKYWPSGLIQQITYANGTVSNYGQNPRLWPATFNTQKTGGSLYLNSSYTYDGTGNLATIRDTANSAFNRTLGYDNINRLTSVAGFWGEGSIAYSGGGNILKQTLGQSTLNYSYDAQNRLSAVSGLRANSYGYDAYGNISSSQGTTYTYNGVPNLVCINCSNPAGKIEYRYDGLDHRSSVTRAGAALYEMHDSKGRQLIELKGSTLTEYFYLGDKRIAQEVTP